MNKIRIALLIGSGSRVSSLLECAKGTQNVDIVFVLSCKGEGIGIEVAKEYGIEVGVIRWKDYRKDKTQGRKNFSQEVTKMLRDRKVDFIILAGWVVLMPKEFVEEFNGRIVNIHPSILPAYPGDGAKAIHAQWESKAEPAGCTLHFVDEDMDTGEVILHGYVRVSDYKSEEELADAIHAKEDEVLCEALKMIAKGAL